MTSFKKRKITTMTREESNVTLPNDIIIDILNRLPVKLVGRFRCVSKEWQCLLSDPGFIKTYQQNLLNRNHLIFSPGTNGSLYSLPVNNNHEAVSTLPKFPLEAKYVDLEGSINGLVLVSGYPNVFVVLNLTTREYVKFPNFRRKLDVSNATPFSKTGFGYDSKTDDYKVVTIFHRSIHFKNVVPRNKMYVHVYSLRSGTWRKLSNSPYDDYYGDLSSGVNVNGCIHWIARKFSDRIPVVVAFRFADEKFSEVPSPPHLFTGANQTSDLDCKLVEFGEKLAIFHDVKGEVWVMNEYGVMESWTKIEINGFDKIPKVVNINPRMFYDNGKLLIVTHDRVLTYDLEEQTFCKSVVIPDREERMIMSSYVESLVSPKFADTITNRQK